MRTFRIILADDEPNILYGMQKGLDWERLGFSVVGTAQNGKEVFRGKGLYQGKSNQFHFCCVGGDGSADTAAEAVDQRGTPEFF